MKFDNHEFRRKNLKDSLLALEDKRDKLYDEIRQLQKPETNRMLAEDLGTANKGYRFQQMLLVLVQHEEIITYETITENPYSLIEITSDVQKSRHIYRIGDAFYQKRRDWEDRQEGDYISELNRIYRHDKYLPTFFINGRYYYMERDNYCDELINEDIHDNLKFKGYPNGIYHVLVQASQYGGGMDYWGEYDEGNIEIEYKIYSSVPLYEFLARKDDMIAEANPEAEELADRYLYIQQTKQGRCKRETPDIDKDWSFSDIFTSARPEEPRISPLQIRESYGPAIINPNGIARMSG